MFFQFPCKVKVLIPLFAFFQFYWWFLTGVWVTASLQKSSRLFSVFWPILIMLLSGWSLLDLLFPSLPVLLPILWGIVPSAPTTNGITVTFMFHSYYYYHYYYYSGQLFHTSVSWWSFTGVWVTASLLKYPGLFSVFWLILVIL